MLLVKERRERVGLSQERLAEAAGVTVRTLRRIENRAGYEPGVYVAARIADALGTPLADLIHDEEATAAAGKPREVPGGHGGREGSGRKSSKTQPARSLVAQRSGSERVE